ncbi:THO complex subunit 1 [Psilocybe cubensis]|uniref:THO complex subunit 1 n=2 Tax=Psilocybe cubensis TaxID=181762 RepID=A0ACB8HEF9_PSICU|nr:THO complex subunit 1 [Psilocybe cubensis]KAH9486400.1 THO complex subunit 1 [Psilocybe cubensis]
MASLQPHLTSLLKSLPPSPADKEALDKLVEHTLLETKNKSSPENKKSQWEYLLKNDIFLLAASEGTALKSDEQKYYTQLCEKLDVILTFTEQDACEPSFPLIVLQDLLETQTIASCSHIFSWIESRADRLTEGMIPQKGKALILLRTLNDLLRRLSKMGTTTIFCGRILTFLSGVFPLGERSGVNLRGEYGPTWEGVLFTDKAKPDNSSADVRAEENKVNGPTQENIKDSEKMEVDEKKALPVQTPAEKKEDFYNTFWSLQLPFSKPSLFAQKTTFEEFKEAVGKVMPVIKEATAKERAMMGSRSGVGNLGTLKRKRDSEEETNSNEYFFAKFLTNPDLLDLEIADTHFRRQFLFQLATLLNHLLNFTKTAKAAWYTVRNRSLQMDFTLEDLEVQWVQDTLTKITEELRQTTPNGRTFADTVNVILERERNWVKWKNELCTPFDREPWSQDINGEKVDFFEATKGDREQLRKPPSEWQWKMGTEALTEIWDMGYTNLEDLKMPFQPGDVKDFVKKIKQEDARISLRNQRLEKMAALAKSRAASAANQAKSATPNPPPTIVVSAESSTPVKSETATTRAEPAPGTLAAPRPISAVSNSPIHPSLPPKPGSPSKLASSSQEPVKIVNSSPNVGPAPLPVSTPVPAASPAPTPVPVPTDPEITKYEDNKQRWAWLALRAARDQYLQHFGRIGTGDIEALAQEIEKEKDKPQRMEDVASSTIGEEQGSGSPSFGQLQRDTEGDVKMEG